MSMGLESRALIETPTGYQNAFLAGSPQRQASLGDFAFYGYCLNIFSIALFTFFSFFSPLFDSASLAIPRQIIFLPLASYRSTTRVPTWVVSGVIVDIPPPHAHPPVPHSLYEVWFFMPLLATTI